MNPVPIHIAVEDDLSEAVARRMLAQSAIPYAVGQCYSRGGFGYLKRTIGGFNAGARGCPYLVVTDLDRTACAPDLVGDWLTHPPHRNLLFRVAVREVESWVLADRVACATFLRVPRARIPLDTDAIPDPKQHLLNLIRLSASSSLKRDMLPPAGSLRTIGPLYNGRLVQFVMTKWSAANARQNSNSLGRAMTRIDTFDPTWPPATA